METVNLVMNLGNIVSIVAVLFLMQAIIKNRNVLKGYSVSGAFLTFIAVLFFEIGFYLMENYIGFGLGLINLTFWLMAFIFSLNNLIHEQK